MPGDSIRVFLSWSGQRSRTVAVALREWLPNVIQAVEPFFSDEDIPKGAQWASTLLSELATTDFTIVCITPENQDEPWLAFEAGAAALAMTREHIAPLLIDLDKLEFVGSPLSVFQATALEPGDMLRLVQSINRGMESPRPDAQLEKAFQKWWPDLEEDLTKIGPAQEPAPRKTPDDLLRDTLAAVRDQGQAVQEQTSMLEKILSILAPRAMTIKPSEQIDWPAITLKSPTTFTISDQIMARYPSLAKTFEQQFISLKERQPGEGHEVQEKSAAPESKTKRTPKAKRKK